MIIFLILLVIAVPTAIAFCTGAVYADYRKQKVPELAPPATRRTPELPTRNDRWLNEQEHALTPNETFTHKNCRVCGPGPLMKFEVPSAYDHVYLKDTLYTDDYGFKRKSLAPTASPDDAEVVSSQIEGTSWHTPMIDIDLPTRVLETSTPGHFHLYIDKPVKLKPYLKMLKAMTEAGIVEPGFYKAACGRKATHLRVPWVEKPEN